MQSANLILIKILIKLFALLPFRILYILSDFFFFVLYHLTKYRRKIVRANLTNSFPQKPSDEIISIEKKYYRHLCDTIVESIKGLSLSAEDLKKRFNYVNPDIFPKDKSAILLGSHYGNWEWGVLSFPMSVNHTVLGIYKPIKDKALDKYLNMLRKQWGLHLAPMAKAGRAIVEYSSQPTLIVLITDQTPVDIVNAHWLIFLNQDTPFLHGADKLSTRTGLPVYYFEIMKTKRGFYEVHFSELSNETEKLNYRELTKKYAEALEETISNKPEYWLWSHRRWKRKRPANS